MGQIFTPTAENWPAAADAVVIGGGIVGAATAFWLAAPAWTPCCWRCGAIWAA